MLSAVIVRAVVLLLLVSSGGLAQQVAVNPFAGSAADIDVGRGTFRIYCSPCHGIAAGGGRGPDLTLGVYNAGATDADLFKVISEGVSGSEMPGYGARMNENSIWRIVAYIRSAAKPSPPPATGDATQGRELYHGKAGCAACHQLGAHGGRLGPDLTRVGRSRSPAYLREALAEPEADLTPGYRTVEVVTADGRKIQGVERSFDNFAVVLMDQAERLQSFSRDELKSADRPQRSLMPSYADSLTAAELDDLVAYLSQLGREQEVP